MDEPNFNENDITKENFADVASEKVCRILCFPGNESFRAWAVKFLQKATRGFGHSEHEPWLNSLSTVESTEAILSNCKSSIRKLDLSTPSVNSSLSFVISHPLQFNPFIAALARLFISQIEESQQRFCVSRKKVVEQCDAFHAKKTDVGTGIRPIGRNNYENKSESYPQKYFSGNISDSGPSKKRRTSCGTRSLKREEALGFLKHVWIWAKTGYVKFDTDLLGDILYHLPECIEEVAISWAKEALKSSQRGNPTDNQGVNLSSTTAGFRRDSNPSDDDDLHSLSVLQESPVFLAAAASSPKLFQRSSSILNQLLIQASECSCSWSPLLSLCKTFAQETAKGRAGYYPLEVQPLILLMELNPNILSSNEQREFISSQLTPVCKRLPIEITVVVLSHFPAWLPFLDYTTLL